MTRRIMPWVRLRLGAVLHWRRESLVNPCIPNYCWVSPRTRGFAWVRYCLNPLFLDIHAATHHLPRTKAGPRTKRYSLYYRATRYYLFHWVSRFLPRKRVNPSFPYVNMGYLVRYLQYPLAVLCFPQYEQVALRSICLVLFDMLPTVEKKKLSKRMFPRSTSIINFQDFGERYGWREFCAALWCARGWWRVVPWAPVLSVAERHRQLRLF